MTKETLAKIESRVWPKAQGLAAKAYVGDVAALTTEVRRCWAEIEQLKKSQGVSPKPFEDPCIFMAGGPDV